jgi:prolyl oligopeptidase
MLRISKFTIGQIACPEYGCVDSGNVTVFENLKRLSPLHNVKLPVEPTVQYPAILLLTGDNDDRVVPANSYKFVAELQYVIGRSERQVVIIIIVQ